MEREALRVVASEPGGEERHENTLTVEQLAAESGMSVRNIRAHQARGLLPAPEVRHRVGYYGPGHVKRLQLIAQLQADGFNLKGIERLLEGASGEASDAIMSFRRAVTEPFESEQPQIFTLSELRERFGDDATPLLLRRAIKLELVSPVGPASFEVASPRLLEIAAGMIEQGVSAEALLDVVDVMKRSSGYVAEAFAQLFVASIWKPFEERGRPEEEWPEVVDAIQRMRPVATQALEAMFQMTMTKTVEDEFGRELQRMSGQEPGKRRRRR
ncbi:MAG: MerR family transcriptional regulator [Actinomycetota bacterium]|nr:MerR family transcriptional regulator [Actinomycetota bacterium]